PHHLNLNFPSSLGARHTFHPPLSSCQQSLTLTMGTHYNDDENLHQDHSCHVCPLLTNIVDVHRKYDKSPPFFQRDGVKCLYFSFLEKSMFEKGTNPSHKILKSEVSNLQPRRLA